MFKKFLKFLSLALMLLFLWVISQGVIYLYHGRTWQGVLILIWGLLNLYIANYNFKYLWLRRKKK